VGHKDPGKGFPTRALLKSSRDWRTRASF